MTPPADPQSLPRPAWRTPVVLMLCGAAVFMLNTGTRQSFGLFLHPMTGAHGWGREVFALAVALAALAVGALTPFMGAIADRYGSGRVLLFGGAMWVVGLAGMAQAATPLQLVLSTGVLVGIGASATSAPIAIGAVGRQVPEKQRSLALGIVTAGGSMGQAVLLPLAQVLISTFGWQLALLLMGTLMVLIVPAAAGLAGRPAADPRSGGEQAIGAALKEAGGHRGYLMLTAGFFVCGFHVNYIATHLPSYVVDSGIAPSIGAAALFLIGVFNIAGSTAWGRWGGRHRKKYLLSTIYLSRAAVITAFYLLPTTPVTVLAFAALMGFLWLGTVPLTSGLVGQMLGVRYLSTLFGIVFFSHQVGGFLGTWLGGYIYDVTGSYDVAWLVAIALGVASALIHLPIHDAPVQRVAAEAAAGD